MAIGAAPELTIRLFGGLDINVNGSPFPRTVPGKARLLLAMLALEPDARIRRPQAAARLWPVVDTGQATLYLNRIVWQLRKALGTQAYRLPSADAMERALWMDWAGADVDVTAFDAALALGDRESLERAVALYRGPLLAGYSDSPARLDFWITEARAQRLRAYQEALKHLSTDARGRGDSEGAIAYLRRCVAADPFWEPMQRELMEVLEETSNTNAALDQYRELAGRLQGVCRRDPEPDTTALYRAILKRSQTRNRPVEPTNYSQQYVAVNTIPCALTELIGRDEELPRLEACIRANRLVTLTGPGGVGKTRLAVALASRIQHEFADGAVFVELAALSDPQLAAHTVAAALGLHEEPGRDILQIVRQFLRGKSLLLVLDNCEHMREACAHLARAALECGPAVRVLATSRQGLGLFGEKAWNVPSLATPDPETLPEDAALPDYLREFAAIRLFVQRASAGEHGFILSAQNARHLARICHRLDGIPLAIELAAVRCAVMSVPELAAKLDRLFDLLTEGDTTALPRHQTLRALIDWSYQLLDPPERTLIRRLSVFRGGWTLDMARSACAYLPIEAADVLPIHDSLVRQSLILSAPSPRGVERYRMLETVREFCHQSLVEGGESEGSYARHCAALLRFAEEAASSLQGAQQGPWLQALDRDHDNFRTALQWSVDRQQVEMALPLAGALWRFWCLRGYLKEGNTWLSRVLALDAQGNPAVRLAAMNGAGNVAYQQGDYTAATLHFEERLRLAEALHDDAVRAASLASLANVAQSQTNLPRARELFDLSLALFQAAGNLRGTALTIANLANLACREQDYALACTYHVRCIAMFRQIGDPQHIALALTNYANTLLTTGDVGRVLPLLKESLALNTSLVNPRGLTQTLANFVSLAIIQGQFQRAAVLIGTAEAVRERTQLSLPPNAVSAYLRARNEVAAALGEDAYLEANNWGRSLTSDQAVAFAMGEASDQRQD